MEYELMFLIAEETKPELPRIKDVVKKIVETVGGTWVGEPLEFEKKLAYKIKHQWRGVYYVQRFTLPGKDDKKESTDSTQKNAIGEITNQMNLQTDILRYIIVSAEDLPSLDSFAQQFAKGEKEQKTTLKEKGEKIDEKLEEALNI